MRIITTEKFDKKYKKLSDSFKSNIDATLEKFIHNPFDPSLLNHNLQGRLKGLKSIKAGFDLRIVFKEERGYVVVVLIDVGKHDEVY